MNDTDNTDITDLNEFEIQLLTFLDQQYHLTGALLSEEKAHSEFGIPIPKYSAALKKKAFRDALTERGVTFEHLGDPDQPNWISKSLTPVQLLAANSLLDLTDTRTNKKKLQDLGISTTKYNAWLKDPVFKEYLAKRAEQLMGENIHEVDLALLDRVRQGDMKAIAYYNEFTGRYVPVRANPNAGSNIDIHGILVKVIEIVNEEVEDSKTIAAIGNRLRALIGANNVARALTDDEPIVIPEVISTRKVPKELSNGNL